MGCRRGAQKGRATVRGGNHLDMLIRPTKGLPASFAFFFPLGFFGWEFTCSATEHVPAYSRDYP